MYRVLFQLVLRHLDPERAHALAAGVIRLLGRRPAADLTRLLTAPGSELRTEAFGLVFPSPFGVAAGFDKDAHYVEGLAALGFGHVEVGTVTPRPQPGNPRPRLYRLVADRALINRMGFNNLGAEQAAALLRSRRRDGRILVGVNIGKNRDTAPEHAVGDYVAAARAVREVADYLAVNVSSPNTPGLRSLQAAESLEPILRAVQETVGEVPLLVKIAPDLDDAQLREIAALVVRLGLAGIIATNTTVSRAGLRTPARIVEAYGAGGLSGAPLRRRSLEVLRLLREELPSRIAIVSAGGVVTAEDVRERLEAGATLVQGYTAFLYEGPGWARRINRDLAAATASPPRRSHRP